MLENTRLDMEPDTIYLGTSLSTDLFHRIRTSKPSSYDSLLRPNFYLAPDPSKFISTSLKVSHVSKFAHEQGIGTGNARSGSSSAPTRGTSYDYHMTAKLRLQKVQPMPDRMMGDILVRWYEIAERGKRNGLDDDNGPVIWPDVVGSLYSQSIKDQHNDEKMLQKTLRDHLSVILRVISRTVFVATGLGHPVDQDGWGKECGLFKLDQPGDSVLDHIFPPIQAPRRREYLSHR